MKVCIYLDDVRIPTEKKWILVKNYDQFVSKIESIGLENIEMISLDHDLGDTAMKEYFQTVKTGVINYDNILEKTGLDCAKWLVETYMEKERDFEFPYVQVHSANFVGSKNISSYINNFLKFNDKEETCKRVKVPHTINN